MPTIAQSLAGLPAFLAYFALAVLLLALFLVIYLQATPYPELKLIREGNTAAAITLSGSLLGFVLPLISAIAHSVSLLDMLVWGAVALVVQIGVYFAVSRLVPHLPREISEGHVAQATLLAALAVAVGLLNAACMTY
jgi:putative membrane protein